MMVRGKDIEVQLVINTDKFSESLEKVRHSMSPFASALRGISMAVEAHIKADSRVGANKRTVAVFMAAERLYEIDQGVQAGILDSLGFLIENEEGTTADAEETT